MGGPLRRAALRLEEPAITVAAGSVLALAVVPPLVQIAGDLVGHRSSLSLLADGDLWRLLVSSVALSAAVTVFAVTVGVPLGLLFARGAFPFRKTLLAAHVAVVFLPPFLPALGWFHVFGREGWLGGSLTSHLLFSELGVVLVLSSCFIPIATALTAAGVSGVDPSLEEAARIAAGPWRTAAHVLVPCSAPVIVLAGVLVFTLAFSELGVPMFLRVDVYPAVVFSRLGGMDFAPGEAAVFVLPLLLVGAGLWWLEHRLAGRRAIAALGSRARSGKPLFRSRWSFCAVAVLAATVSMLPIFALIVQASVGGGWTRMTAWTGDSPWNGLRASVIAAVVMTAVALVLGRALARGSRVGTALDGLAMIAFIVPSSILGVGLIEVWNRPGLSRLYASFGMLAVGFVARYSAVATRTFAASVAQVPPSLEDAARVTGAGYVRLLGLWLGLGRRGLLLAFVLAWVLAFRDLDTAALFYPPGGEPLTVRIFTLEANGPPAVVSALAVLHVAITFAGIGLCWLLLHPRSAR